VKNKSVFTKVSVGVILDMALEWLTSQGYVVKQTTDEKYSSRRLVVLEKGNIRLIWFGIALDRWRKYNMLPHNAIDIRAYPDRRAQFCNLTIEKKDGEMWKPVETSTFTWSFEAAKKWIQEQE